MGKPLSTILTYFSSIALDTQTLQHLMSSMCPLNDYFFEFKKLSTKLNFSQSVFFSTSFPFHISSGFPYCLKHLTRSLSFLICEFPSIFSIFFSFTHEKSLAVSVVCGLTSPRALPEASLSQIRLVSRIPGSAPGRLPSPTDPPCSAGRNLHSVCWAPPHHEPGGKKSIS